LSRVFFLIFFVLLLIVCVRLMDVEPCDFTTNIRVVYAPSAMDPFNAINTATITHLYFLQAAGN